LALVFRMEFLAQVDSFPVFGTYFLMMNWHEPEIFDRIFWLISQNHIGASCIGILVSCHKLIPDLISNFQA
jgi:hypothetical protein